MRDRNEALDVRCYARAAAAVCGIDRYTNAHWQEFENRLNAQRQAAPPRRERPMRFKMDGRSDDWFRE